MKIINVFTNKTDVSEKLSVTLKEILEKKNFSVSYSYNPNAILNIWYYQNVQRGLQGRSDLETGHRSDWGVMASGNQGSAVLLDSHPQSHRSR